MRSMPTPPTVSARTDPAWRRLALVVGFALLAFVLTAVAGGVSTALLAANLEPSPAIPWAVVVMAVLLWLLWRYLGGAAGRAAPLRLDIVICERAGFRVRPSRGPWELVCSRSSP